MVNYRRRHFIFPLYKIFEKATYIFNRRVHIVPYPPLTFFIDVTTRCNLHCEMCTTPFLPRTRIGDLSFKEFRQILQQFSPVQTKYMEVQGSGEPLLNPELINMLRLAKERGFTTTIYTNGTLMNENRARDFVSVLNHIWFSVDGATKETYEIIRRGSAFERDTSNISKFTKINRMVGDRMQVNINSVVSRLNYMEMADIVMLAHKLGVDRVTFKVVIKQFPGKTFNVYDEKIKNLQKMRSQDLMKQYKKADELGRKYGVITLFYPREHRAKKCKFPWTSLYITHDGYVTPCCIQTNPEIINFGNLFQKPLKKIWNGPEYQEFRKKLMSDNPPKLCVECGL